MKTSTQVVLLALWLVGSGAIVLAVLLLPLSYGLGDMCGNKIQAQSPSPDGRLKLVVFSRDCGATTGFSIQASLLRAKEDLPAEAGNLFVADDSGTDPSQQLRARWDGPESLSLSYPTGLPVIQAKKRLRGIDIRYATFP
jgi:hypothetical protein